MKKLFKLILWTVFILAVVVIVGGYIFIRTFDLNKYKSQLQNLVYQQTGRQLVLNGDAGLKISLIPTIVLNDVALSNAAWAKEKNMLQAQSVEVSFSLLPLLHKEVVLDTIDLVKPQVFLAVNKNGEGNWNFAKPVKQVQPVNQDKKAGLSNLLIGSAYAAQVPTKEEVAALPLSVVAKNIKIEQGLITYTDMKNGQTVKVAIQSLLLSSAGMNDDIKLDFDVNYNGNNIVGTATAGSINSLLQKAEKYPVKADLTAFGAKLQADVVVQNLTGDMKFSGNVKAQNPAGNMGAPAVKADTDISGNPKEITAVLKSLNVAGNVLTGRVKVDLKGVKPYISGDLKSAQIDVRTLTAKPQKQAAFGLVSTAAAAQFVPAVPLDLSALNSVNAKVNASVGKIVVDNNITADNVQVTAALNNGLLTLSPLQFDIGGGTVSGSASVNANGNVVRTDLTGKSLTLQKLWPGFAVTDGKTFGITSGGKTDLSVSLRGQGMTMRQIVENLNGQLIVVVGEAKIQTGALKYLSGNFVTQLLSMLHIEQQQKNMDLKCAVVRTDITNGLAAFPKGIVFNAEQMVIVSDGSVNLKNDKLNLMIHPFNGKLVDTNVAQAISSMIKITGTIQKPCLGLDNSSVVKNVVGVAAGGPAFLGSQLLLDKDDSPCHTALKGTTYQNMFPAATGVKAAGQEVYRGAGDAVTMGVDALTDTAKGVLNLFKRK